jgi:hypothetical protein
MRVRRYMVLPLSMNCNAFEFQTPVKVYDRQLYNIGTKMSVTPHVEFINPNMCGRCIKHDRCVRCQKVGTKRSSVCMNINHVYCQECIQQIPCYLRRAVRKKDELVKLIPGYNPRACTSFGGPYCWLCYTPGITLICFVYLCFLRYCAYMSSF